eukprot:TRINITY_DN11454_c0_g1_i1.p1 TRINITY_DN11454_c0_g1~~TRINITY_DN11454_c0_g1_i1.p1  ORF type:complete len:1029 (+),score=406.18 TRINITY_DN11454_c0_g1_i1:471-3557(+)
MSSLLTNKLAKLQHSQENIRNICILAHVDHGKTSLADSLVATNGVISSRLAGKLRYMDSRKDEQERGITMKSSAIALFYLAEGKEYLVNLMDSPGHVDFSSEVSTAVRLCDGAILVVDVVEGVQPQTKVVLRQAWDEGIKPVLVLNKVDRLIGEMGQDPLAAYHHMVHVLEQVNALVAEMFTQEVLEKSNKVKQEKEVEIGIEDVFDWSDGLEDADDSNLYFSPEMGNVVFCSAVDGWAFSLNTFAKIYSKKLGFSESVLQRTLWGDFYINMKAKKIYNGAGAKAKKPLFVSLVLENIWAVYDAVMVRKDKDRLEKIVKALSLTVPPRDLRSTDPRQQLSAVFSSWLPLATAVLSMVATKLPSPAQLGAERAEKLLCSKTKRFSSLSPATQELKEHFVSCSPSGPTIIFISKMFPVSRSQLPEHKARPLTAEELAQRREVARARHAEKQQGEGVVQNVSEQVVQMTSEQVKQLTVGEKEVNAGEGEKESDLAFIAFARVYSGCVEAGQELWVIGPKYDPALTAEALETGQVPPNCHVTKATMGNLYILLGRDLEQVDKVPAGNVLGIAGLASSVLKSATLSTTPWCPPFVPVVQSSVPILRVAVEPALSSDLPKLEAGLQLLNQADAHVEVLVSEAGEHLLVTAGEVHLQRCLADLTLEYAGCEVSVSEPIVPFRETIVKPPETDMVNEAIQEGKEEEDLIVMETPNKQCLIKIRAVPLPPKLTLMLEEQSDLLRAMDRQKGQLTSNTLEEVDKLRKEVTKLLDSEEKLAGTGDKIWSLGPKRCGPNMLINRTGDFVSSEVWPGGLVTRDNSDTRTDMESSLVQGFQLATLAGPLCEEQIMGVAFVVEGWEVKEATAGESGWGPVSGQIVSIMKDCCRKAFLAKPVRLMTAMYACSIAVKAEVLGKMFNVLNRRRGQVVKEELIEGSSTFTVTAHIPVIESMNFGSELRKQTSGMAMPQLVFSHWEVVDVDPFWEPKTEEELLHFGDKADSENPALRYMNDIRKRKGLKIDEKLVEFAEKQRTLTKSK